MNMFKFGNSVAALTVLTLSGCGGDNGATPASTNASSSGGAGAAMAEASPGTTPSSVQDAAVPTWQGIRQGSAPYGWKLLLETQAPGAGYAAATDKQGNVIIGGASEGTFAPQVGTYPNGIPGNAFIAKYNATGTYQWGTSLLDPHLDAFGWTGYSPAALNDGNPEVGTNDTADAVYGTATDASGDIYAVGQTMPGGVTGESLFFSAFITKLSPTGKRLWLHGLGSPGQYDSTTGNAVAVDSKGNAYMVGASYAVLPGQTAVASVLHYFIAKYDPSGNRLWLKEGFFNAPSGSAPVISVATGVAVDASGNAYITGYNHLHLVLAKYSSAGNLLWETYLADALEPPGDVYQPVLIGTPTGIAVSANGDTIFVAGDTSLLLNSSGPPYTPVSANYNNVPTTNAYVMEFNGTGTRQWIRTLGATTTTKCPQNINGTKVCGFSSQAIGVTAKSDGSAVFITGLTYGALPGRTATNTPARDFTSKNVIVAGWKANGALLWTRQMGAGPVNGATTAPGRDEGTGIAMDTAGDLFVTGQTHGRFGTLGVGASETLDNWFVLKMNPTNGSVY